MSNRFVLNPISYHGYGAIDNIVVEARNHGFTKAFIASDPSLIKAGVVAQVSILLDKAALPYVIYDEIKPNPTIKNVQGGVSAFKKSGADFILAVGGGSVIDTAKAIGIIITNPEFSDVLSLEGVAPTKNPCVPIFAVPTTAGTAAEVTINYVITDENKNRKFVCVDPHDIPIIAFVDPKLMETMPNSLAAATGMDALTHAIEGLITKGAWELSDALHLEAIRIISHNLCDSLAGNKHGKEEMALGQYVAGMGFSNVGLGMVHAMAHPLSALYDTPHGVACAIILTTGMRFNAPYSGEKYREICRVMGVEGYEKMSQEEYRQAAIDAVQKLSDDVGIPKGLSFVKEEDVNFIADCAMADACMPGNPAPITKEQVIELYHSLMGK